MNIKRVTGDAGEKAVCRYLRRRGYKIEARNYFCRFGEIDIIAVKGGFLCFVEVKTRSPGSLGTPGSAVDHRKQRRIIITAEHYLAGSGFEMQPRFDVAEVRLNDKGKIDDINYIENAFILN